MYSYYDNNMYFSRKSTFTWRVFKTFFHKTFILTLGQFVPNSIPLLYGLGGISPVAASCLEQPGAVCQGCIAPPLYDGLPLTDGPSCFTFWRRDGGISSRVTPFPKIGKGRGDRVEHQGGFTYEFYQQPLWAHDERSSPLWEASPAEGPRKDRLVRGVLIGGGLPVFSATGSTSKSKADMLAFGPKRRPVCKGFRPQPWREEYDFLIHSRLSQILLTFCSGAAEALRGKLSCKNTLSARACGHSSRETNAISLLAYFGGNTFHIWRTRGD